MLARRRSYYLSRWTASVLLLVVGGVLAGCESPSILLPASPEAKSIYDLLITFFVIAAAAFVIVEALLIFVVVRFSRRPSAARVAASTSSKQLEIAWTLAPAAVLALLFVLSAFTLRTLVSDAAAPEGHTLAVRVVARQWWWEFQYPGLDVVTATELHVPVGARVELTMTSADVVHSFWVPQLGGKVDVIPGSTTETRFTASKVGRYRGECSEFCGVQHAGMHFEVVAEPQPAFDLWVQQQQAPAQAATGAAAAGAQVFSAAMCGRCHAIAGSDAMGRSGPNLTHFASRGSFAGASYPNTADNVTMWLNDPQHMKPGNLMPKPNLSPDEIRSLVVYLASLK